MKGKLYIGVLLLLVGGLIVAEATRPRPLDTRVRLEREGDAPFDAEVMFEALPAWLGQPVEVVPETPFERLADSTVTGRTYVFLTQSFAPDEAEAKRLLRFVARGNTVFVAAQAFGGPFGEVLGAPGDSSASTGAVGLRTDLSVNVPYMTRSDLGADTLRLTSPGVEGAYGFPVFVRDARLQGLDLSRTQILGTGDTEVNFVRVAYGKGAVFVSSTPLAFSNAALTGAGDAEAYVGAVLAALPRQPVWWDDAYKPFREQARTPLRYVLQTPALRWAYVLLLVGAVLFLAFRGRRWQRPIPVVAAPPNAQREFARTVGRLHLVHGDERRLVQRKTRVFLDKLRRLLRLDAPDLSPETARRAAARAGVPESEALDLFDTLRRLGESPSVRADALVELDRQIDRFFRHTAAPDSRGDSDA